MGSQLSILLGAWPAYWDDEEVRELFGIGPASVHANVRRTPLRGELGQSGSQYFWVWGEGHTLVFPKARII